MNKNKVPITVDLLISLGFREQKSKIGRRFHVWHGCATIDIVLSNFSNAFEFISYTHQPFEIKSLLQLERLVLGLTGEKLETWR